MLDTKEELVNLAIYVIINYLLLGVQTALWPEFFGGLPAPFFLLYSVIFFSLFHPGKWVVAFIAISMFMASAFTVIPIEILLFNLILISIVLGLLKKRVFWSGFSYFSLCSFIAVCLFHICYYAFSWTFEIEEAGASQVQWGFWFLQSLTTVILSPIFYWTYAQIESATRGFDSNEVEEAL